MNSIGQDNIYIEIQESECDREILSNTTNNICQNEKYNINKVDWSQETKNELDTIDSVGEHLFLQDDDLIVNKTIKYSAYTVKQLLLICEYYGIHKEIKYNKLKKDGIIEQIIWYEMQIDNTDVVNTRITLWRYMNEIKQDPILGKFIPSWSIKDS
uniref:Uncharacterized protein n=1 Tax=viral metagenome TaxID=1070528 RepID=A0A6C0FAC8_9ZZZZ|tara:strand:+ start:4871 stop:5338 length:468 start_codon:yes stop_codon:yes gene_type:complete